jgi:hypothetical protein
MKLFTIDEKTKLPIPSPEALMIKCFNDLWRQRLRVEGDHDGRDKLQNRRILGYVYFQSVYDSRFKLKNPKERDEAIKKILGIDPDWIPDALVKECIAVFSDTQITASYELVSSLEGAASALAQYVKNAQEVIRNGTVTTLDPKHVKDIMDIIDRAPTTVETLSKAKAVLNKEQDALATGRKGRVVNKYEMPDQ